jgi:hypothetical protein
MSSALEERSTTELLGRNNAIKVLKKENELIKTEKAKLLEEVAELVSLRLEVGGLRTEKEKVALEVVELKKQANSSKGAEALTVEHALKVNKTSKNLRRELDAEKQSSLALQQQVNMLSARLKAAEELALATARAYSAILGEFGDNTYALSEEPSAFNLLSWLKAHVEKLPSFVGGAVDCGALARATNFAKMLAHGGCPRAKGI